VGGVQINKQSERCGLMRKMQKSFVYRFAINKWKLYDDKGPKLEARRHSFKEEKEAKTKKESNISLSVCLHRKRLMTRTVCPSDCKGPT